MNPLFSINEGDYSFEDIELPVLGQIVRVRALLADERREFISAFTNTRYKIGSGIEAVRKRIEDSLLHRTVIEEDGKYLFKSGDLKDPPGLVGEDRKAVLDAALFLSGLTDDDIEEWAQGNSVD